MLFIYQMPFNRCSMFNVPGPSSVLRRGLSAEAKLNAQVSLRASWAPSLRSLTTYSSSSSISPSSLLRSLNWWFWSIDLLRRCFRFVSPFLAFCLDADLSSASATPSTLGLQRSRLARKPRKTISLDQSPPVVRHQVPTLPVNGAPAETAAPPFADLTPMNSRPSLPSVMTMSLVAQVRLAQRPPTPFRK